ncbi:hypothetical protein PR048_015838, partial [Dryococelus australis]
MNKIESSCKQSTRINQAGAIRRMLDDRVFVFWLTVFHNIMPHVDVLYNQLQKRNRKRKVKIQAEMLVSKKKKKKKKVEDVPIPVHLLGHTTKRYPFFLDKARLKTELGVVYKRLDFLNMSGSVSLLQFVVENNLKTTFTKTNNLLLNISTVPMTTPQAERCFSTLKRIKTFLRSTMSKDRLSTSAMLSIEKYMVNKIPNSNDRVIDLFSSKKKKKKKNRRIDLV